MAPLTWKNIDAPNFVGTGNLMSGFGASLGQLGADLRERADRRRQQGVDSYSADALMKLAGVRDQAQFDALRQGLDGSKMSTPALDLFFQHPGLLLEREKLGTEIAGQRIQNDGSVIQNTGFQLDNDQQRITNADLQGDLEAERQGRADQALFNPVRARAVEMASKGQYDAAATLLSDFAAKNPSASGLAASAQEELLGRYRDHQEVRGVDENRNLEIQGRERGNRALDYVHKAGNTFATKAEAIAYANRDSSIGSEQDRQAIIQQISSVPDEQWMPVDPMAAEAFPNWAGRTGVAARDIWRGEQSESAAAIAQIESAQTNNNAYQFKVLQDNITAKTADKNITDAPAVLKEMGFDDGYIRTATEDVNWVENEMRKLGSAVSPQAVLAAVVQMRNTGFIDSNKNFVENEEAAVQLLKDMIDPANIKAQTEQGLRLDGFKKDLADKVSQIEAQRTRVSKLRAAGSPMTEQEQSRLDGMAQSLEASQNAWAAELQAKSDKDGGITRDANGQVIDSPELRAQAAALKNKQDQSAQMIRNGATSSQALLELATSAQAQRQARNQDTNATNQNLARLAEQARNQPGFLDRLFGF